MVHGTCSCCMAERKAGCVCLASPTGISNPHSGPVHDTDTIHMVAHLSDWDLSVENGDRCNCIWNIYVKALQFVCHHRCNFQHCLTQKVWRWKHRKKSKMFLECSLKNSTCTTTTVVPCTTHTAGVVHRKKSREGFLEAVWQWRTAWVLRHDFCLANLKLNVRGRTYTASPEYFNIDNVYWGQAESKDMSLKSHSLCLCADPLPLNKTLHGQQKNQTQMIIHCGYSQSCCPITKREGGPKFNQKECEICTSAFVLSGLTQA